MSAIISKVGIVTGNTVLQVTLTRKNFTDIPNILMCRERRMLVVVKGRRPYCWSCGVLQHMTKACPEKNVSQTPATTTTVEAEALKPPVGAWKKVVTKGRKSTRNSPSPQQDVPPKKQSEEQ